MSKNNIDPFVFCFTSIPASSLSSSSLHILKCNGFQGSEPGPPYLFLNSLSLKLYDLLKLNHNFHNISQVSIFHCDQLLVGLDSPTAS